MQAKVLTENPKALYLYCFGHQLNLVVQDSLKTIPEVAIALERMHSVVQLIKNSPKKWHRFKSIVNFASTDDLSFPKDNHRLRPLCTTRWVMRLPSVDTFLVHYHEILEFLESIKEDYTEPANNREKADSILRNLETFKNYFCLRVIQKVLQAASPIHVQCQGKGATVGQVKIWVNTLILTLTAEWQGHLNSDDLYEAVKTLNTEELHLDLPSLPRANRTRGSVIKAGPITDEQIKDFYTSMYRSVMEAGAKALIDRYSKNDLSTVELLRRCLEDDTMTDEDITTLAEYYNGDIDLGQLLFERNNWFTRCTCITHSICRLGSRNFSDSSSGNVFPL